MTPKAEQLIARQDTYAKFPFLIKVDHSTFEEPLYFANAEEDVSYGGETYLAAYFTIDPPDQDGGKIGDGQLTISAVDQTWIARVRTAQTAAKITFIAAIVYEDGDMTGVEAIEEMDFTLRAASWNEEAIVWAMAHDEGMGIIVPCDRATALKCPGVA